LLRGGFWGNNSRECHASNRRSYNPGYVDNSFGFRAARNP
jgi:formylglycine-generating enzyme required for sulfatase activity